MLNRESVRNALKVPGFGCIQIFGQLLPLAPLVMGYRNTEESGIVGG